MASFWLFFVIVSFCYTTQLQIVLAAKRELKSRKLGDWRDFADSQGSVDLWVHSSTNKILSTEVRAGGGASWFNTPSLNLPSTSYLDIEASCTNNPFQLEIYGSSDSSLFESIQNVTFKKRSLNTATIKKSTYRYLRILARATSQTTFFIHSIKMYHYVCEKTRKHNTDLSQVDSSTTNISRLVQCRDNSVASDDGKSTNVTVNCTPKGNWTFGDKKCVCDKGYHYNNQECPRCSIHYFKNIVGDEACQKCPDGKTNSTMHTKCKCKEDHYIGDNESGPCYVVPSKVEDLDVQKLTNTSVNITWRKPKDNNGFNGSLTYTVKCYRCIDESKCDTIVKTATFFPAETNLTTTYVNVSNLIFNERYKFRVLSMSSILPNVPGYKWNFAEKMFTFKAVVNKVTTVSPPKDTNTMKASTSNKEGKDKDNIFIYIGAGVAFLVIVLLTVLLVITRWRRGKLKKSGKDNLGFERVPLPDIGQRTYIDPSNFHDPEAALKDFANEIPHKSLTLERVIGGGEFGDVYKGILKTEGGGVIDVAAKTLKHDSDERSRKDFFMEASAMGQFDDPNVIHLEGVITKTVPHMIVTEYMSNGSLDNFLKQNDSNMTHLQLVGMARGVASGMTYLAAMNFIHRDLAARNILVNDALLCKVSDFGLSRELENEGGGEYCTTGGKIPVRWTAPESIKYRKFSTASDVWSYGILLWEIMSFAERPYWDWDNFKVLERVDEGYRLPAPKNCPKSVHELMLLCWDTKDKRPDFPDIVKMLDDWIRSPETIRYEKISTIRSGSGTGISDPAMQIKEWLNDIKMSSYIPHFTQAGFNQLYDLAGLMDSDLQGIGISLIGHRNKMLRTIRSLSITDQSKKTAWKRAPSLVV